jgi:phosphohistidine phosphatase
MKTLLILRHAKSSWKEPSQADHDRPLNERGKRDAPRIGLLLVEQSLVPDVIVSSTAKRARKTAELVARNSGYDGQIQFHQELYLATRETYIRVIRQLDNVHSRALVVGHNPGLQELLEALSGQPAELPTAALAQVSLEIAAWDQLEANGRGVLVNLWRPKELE